MLRIPLHSVTDLITNSSTTIYTYSDASVDACRVMVDEIFKTLGMSKTCDEVFDLDITYDDTCFYSDFLDDNCEDVPAEYEALGDNWRKRGEWLEAQIAQRPKKAWVVAAEEWHAKRRRSYDTSGPSSTLVIRAKELQFEALAEKIGKFLYSTVSEEGES